MQYRVKDSKRTIFITKETPSKFKVGQEAFIDSRKNIYSAHLGGAKFGNPNKAIPATMQILDTGSVNIISDTDTFVSFMFHGKELKGYWIAKRESPKAEIWVFSKSSLPGEPRKEIKHARHRRDKCMECDASPKYEVLWAEGMARIWLCGRHFRAWTLKNMKERKAGGYACDINMVREVQNGIAAKKWKDNTNPDIWPKLRRELK